MHKLYASVFLLATLATLALAAVTIPAPFSGSTPRDQARITSLPGYNGTLPEMYSGYITVDETNGRQLFYWLVKSENSESDPVVLWLQGGPGCSGLLGLLEEHGPFVPDEVGGLVQNPYTWTRVANMLYIEAPAGVGFSYSDTPSDYQTDDTRTAEDNYKLLRGFFEIYTEFKDHRFWVAGESYGGIYVPTLTNQILKGSDAALRRSLQGIMVGNGVFGCHIDYHAIQFDLFYWHGLVSYTNYANWIARGCNSNSGRAGCREINDLAVSQIGVIDQELKRSLKTIRTMAGEKDQPSLDPDNLYQDFCVGNGTLEFTDNDPYKCKQPLGRRTLAYLNNPNVQKAIHAKPARWSPCSSTIDYTSNAGSMLPYYEEFFKANPSVSVLIYAGDIDIATVPFAYNQQCLFQLQRQNVKAWAPWFVQGATAGYVEYFDTYTFATVKGAGHEAPLYQPLSSFNMFSRFIAKGNLDQPTSAEDSQHKTFYPMADVVSQGQVLRNSGIPL